MEGKELTIVMEERGCRDGRSDCDGVFPEIEESFTGSEVTINTEELKKVGALNMIQALNALILLSA